MSDFLITTTAAVSPDEFSGSLDYDDQLQFIVDVDDKNTDVHFSLALVDALVSSWDREDFQESIQEILTIISKLGVLVGY